MANNGTMRVWWIVAAIWASGLGAAAQYGKLAVIFDQISAAYPTSGAATVGFLVSCVGLVGLIFGTSAGLIVPRLGYRRVLVAALLAGAVLSAAQALLPPMPVMLVLRVAEGVSHLVIVVAGPVMISQIAPVARLGAAMTLWSSFFGVAFAVLGFVGPALVETAGLPAMFLTHGCYMASLALVLLLLLPADPPNDAPTLAVWDMIRQHGVIYASPRISAPGLGFSCYTITYVAILTLLPSAFTGQSEQALLAIAFPLVSIAVSLTFGVWALAHKPAVQLVQAGFAGAVLSGAALWLCWPDPFSAMAASFGIAAALGVVQGASFAAIPQLNQSLQDRTRAAGALAQLGNLGTTTGTPMLVYLMFHFGISGFAAFVVVFSGLGIAVHQLQTMRRATG